MKMVKKILLGLTAAALVTSFIGCKQVDDEKKAIDGSNNDYSIDWENLGDENYRAYKSTSLNHAGALVKVTFTDPKDDNYSKMGVIFDLHDDANKAKEFFIIGLAGTKDKNYYVSKFSNVTDIQADNFGTKLKENKAVEKAYVALGAKTLSQPAKAADGSMSYYVYFREYKEAANSTKAKFEYAVFSIANEDAEKAAKAKVKEEATKASDVEAISGVTQLDYGTTDEFDIKDGKLTQNQLAVYAMIPSKKVLKGKWKFLDMYLEAEEIEE